MNILHHEPATEALHERVGVENMHSIELMDGLLLRESSDQPCSFSKHHVELSFCVALLDRLQTGKRGVGGQINLKLQAGRADNILGQKLPVMRRVEI